MTFEQFKSTLAQQHPPPTLPSILQALWHDGKHNWDKAHDIAQDIPTSEGSLVHAYLHRKEEDVSNARYWYSKAGRKMPACSLEEEWENLVKEFLL
jgi:hypothetical protein